MIRDDLVTLIAGRLGNRTDLNDRIIAEMQLAQSLRMEDNGVFQPWFLTTEQATELTDPGELRVPLPDDFIAEIEEQGLWYRSTDGSWVEIPKRSKEDAELRYTGTGAPQAYALVGAYFLLFPTPDIVYNLRMRYAAKQPALTSNVENAWTKYAPDLMMAEVGEQIALLDLQNQKLASGFTDAKQKAWQRLLTVHVAREEANRDRTMGGE